MKSHEYCIKNQCEVTNTPLKQSLKCFLLRVVTSSMVKGNYDKAPR
jgi:hypothetical protein